MLSMFLFVMSVNQKCQRCTTSIKMQKSARIIQKTAQKQAARFFRLPVWGCLSLSDMLSMFLFVMSVNQKCQRCTTSIKMQKSARIIQKTAQKQAARFFRLPVWRMFEPSKAFSMLLFMMPANQAASHCNQNQNANDQRCHLPVAFP